MKILSVLLLISCTYQLTAAWDYIAFVQLWPQTACKNLKSKNPNRNCNLPVRGKWTIHGVWPSNRNYQSEQCSGTEKFETSKIQSIKNDLSNFWPSVYNDNARFWRHEWDKHGRCSDHIPGMDSVFGYFKKSLELNRQYDIEKILTRSNIKPNNQQPVPVNKISDAVRSATGGIPNVRCLNNEYLYEIHICLDQNLQVQHCTRRPNCKNEVFYLDNWGDTRKGDEVEDVKPNVIHASGSTIVGLSFIIGICVVFLLKSM
ncbi:unnamed protein product [Brassicogethes aeneus]|uniref:Uncharacterized protein n=1 Tax=Brassicogethes aeneus TaxID=1431903 RepID=A0A9P0FGH7_BRAAE|nr:unnamed protein product [Brassicogethes aeneus]